MLPGGLFKHVRTMTVLDLLKLTLALRQSSCNTHDSELDKTVSHNAFFDAVVVLRVL